MRFCQCPFLIQGVTNSSFYKNHSNWSYRWIQQLFVNIFLFVLIQCPDILHEIWFACGLFICSLTEVSYKCVRSSNARFQRIIVFHSKRTPSKILFQFKTVIENIKNVRLKKLLRSRKINKFILLKNVWSDLGKVVAKKILARKSRKLW